MFSWAEIFGILRVFMRPGNQSSRVPPSPKTCSTLFRLETASLLVFRLFLPELAPGSRVLAPVPKRASFAASSVDVVAFVAVVDAEGDVAVEGVGAQGAVAPAAVTEGWVASLLPFS